MSLGGHEELILVQSHRMNRTYSIEWENTLLKLNALTSSKGENLLICIHGLGCSSRHFYDAFSGDLCETHHIVAYDCIGFGKSSRPQWFDYSLDNQADLCVSFIQNVLPSHESITIVAHSMGGAIGLLVADKLRGRVRNCVLIEGNLIGDDCGISRTISSMPYEQFASLYLPSLIMRNAASSEPGVRLWAKTLKDADPYALYQSSRSLVLWSDSGTLPKLFNSLQCNRVYFYGERNSHMRALSVVNNIEKISIPHSGHFPMTDNPEVFYFQLNESIANT